MNPKKPREKHTLHVMSTTCATCGKPVGILWYKGESTLFDGPLDADGENLIVNRHQCPVLERGARKDRHQ